MSSDKPDFTWLTLFSAKLPYLSMLFVLELWTVHTITRINDMLRWANFVKTGASKGILYSFNGALHTKHNDGTFMIIFKILIILSDKLRLHKGNWPAVDGNIVTALFCKSFFKTHSAISLKAASHWFPLQPHSAGFGFIMQTHFLSSSCTNIFKSCTDISSSWTNISSSWLIYPSLGLIYMSLKLPLNCFFLKL